MKKKKKNTLILFTFYNFLKIAFWININYAFVEMNDFNKYIEECRSLIRTYK